MKATMKTLFLAGLLSAILLSPCRAQQLLWSGNLGAGWTSLVASQTAAGKPCSIAYYSPTGLVRFDNITHSGGGYGTPVSSNGLNFLASQVIQQGLTHLVPFRISSSQFLFMYNQATGQMFFEKVNANCTSLQTIFTSLPSRAANQFTQFAVYYVNGAPYIIEYNQTTGAISFHMVNPNGAGSTTVWNGNAGPNWTSLITLANSQNEPNFLLYDKTTDDLKLNKINPASQGFVTAFHVCEFEFHIFCRVAHEHEVHCLQGNHGPGLR